MKIGLLAVLFVGIILSAVLFISTDTPVLAQCGEPNCEGLSAAKCAQLYAEVTGCEFNGGTTPTSDPLPLVIGRLVRALFGFLGTAFLVLIIYGGFTWMTAAGNDESVNKAKKIITQATIGLLIVVVAYALSDFIFDSILQATNA